MSEWLRADPAAFEQVLPWLSALDWRLRLSAAEILAGAGEDFVRRTRPELLRALDDNRGLDAYPAHIAAAEILLNPVRHCDRALEVILAGLDIDTHPLIYIAPAADIRQQAALALGKLKAAYRHPQVVERLCQVRDEEGSGKVLNAVYTALLSLVSAPERGAPGLPFEGK